MQGNRTVAKAVCFQQNRQLLICIGSILLFFLERGGLPTDRPAKPLRLDDVEGVGPGDRELVHILHHQRQQLCAALDLDGLCNRFLIVGQDRKQRIFGQVIDTSASSDNVSA